MCARVPNLHSCRRPNCTPKVPNFGFGSHPCSQRETQWCQKNSREREKGSRLLLHTQTRARKGEERERVRSFNHEEVQREFVSKLTRYEYTSSRQRVFSCCSSSKKRKHNCASPSDDNLFDDWGFVFFFASSSSCARCFVPVFSRSRANSANDDDSPFCTSLSLLRYA